MLLVRDEVIHVKKQWGYIAAATGLTLPALAVRAGLFGSAHPPGPMETIMFGVAILGAAFLLSWGAEVLQMDVSQGLAIALLAFIAVLPEYAVDLVFAWKAGRQDIGQAVSCGIEHCRSLSIANMTGANRLLIGLGWAAVVLIWAKRSGHREVVLPGSRRTDLGFLFVATAWAGTIVLRRQVSLIDMFVLGTLFVLYLWHTMKEDVEEPDLIGPPLAIAALSPARRRLVTAGMFLFAAAVILSSAEPFAEGLVHTGEQFGLDTFLLVQWLAPLASEAPEMIIAILFVLRAKPELGLGALVSSKVNQWTLLVGTLPLVYAIAAKSATAPLRLDARQVEEVLLTMAQSLFAVAVLANLRISRAEALGLLLPFLAQFAFQNTTIRYGFAGAYMLGFVVLLARHPEARRGLIQAVKHSMTRPRAGAHAD